MKYDRPVRTPFQPPALDTEHIVKQHTPPYKPRRDKKQEKALKPSLLIGKANTIWFKGQESGNGHLSFSVVLQSK